MATTFERSTHGRLGSVGRRIWQLIARHRIELLTGLAASLPAIVSAAYAVAVGWVPIGDNSIIAARSYDVLTAHTPLLGQYSLSSGLAGATTHSPGPMEYWLLALPARLLDPAALAVTVSAVNVASVMGVVVLARRRGGLSLMFGAAVSVALLCSSLGAEALHSIWNPWAALLPFTLLIFLAWSLACGEFRLLPLTALVFSFVVQCHLGYAVPATGLVVVGLAGLVASRRTISWPLLRRWAVAALLVGLVCWSAPLLEQAIHRPGNLVLIARAGSSDQSRVGAEGGLRALTRGVGIPPWWLRDPQQPTARFLELGARLTAVAVASCALAVVALCLVTLIGLSRRRRDVAAAGAAALTLCAALVLVPASTPTGSLGSSLAYMLQWGAPVGMFVWLVLGWSLGTLWRPGWSFGSLRGSAASYAGLAAVAAVGLGVAAATGPDRKERSYGPVRELSDRLDSRLANGSSVLVDIPRGGKGSPHEFDMQTASAYALRQHGFAVAAPSMKHLLGSWYAGGDRRRSHVLRIEAGAKPRGGGELVTRITSPRQPSPAERKLGARSPPPVSFTLIAAGP